MFVPSGAGGTADAPTSQAKLVRACIGAVPNQFPRTARSHPVLLLLGRRVGGLYIALLFQRKKVRGDYQGSSAVAVFFK